MKKKDWKNPVKFLNQNANEKKDCDYEIYKNNTIYRHMFIILKALIFYSKTIKIHK